MFLSMFLVFLFVLKCGGYLPKSLHVGPQPLHYSWGCLVECSQEYTVSHQLPIDKGWDVSSGAIGGHWLQPNTQLAPGWHCDAEAVEQDWGTDGGGWGQECPNLHTALQACGCSITRFCHITWDKKKLKMLHAFYLRISVNDYTCVCSHEQADGEQAVTLGALEPHVLLA